MYVVIKWLRWYLTHVLPAAYEPLSKQKAPKVIADATSWMKDALIEFGIAGLSLRPLIGYLQAALKNSNAAVRTSATNTLVTLKLFAGAGWSTPHMSQFIVNKKKTSCKGFP
jgi:cytoskeleton-associated protein 5